MVADQVQKRLNRLNPKQRAIIVELIAKIKAGDLHHLDVIKLQGYPNIFRVRKGVHRILFRKNDDGTNTVIAFEQRSDTTYRGL